MGAMSSMIKREYLHCAGRAMKQGFPVLIALTFSGLVSVAQATPDNPGLPVKTQLLGGKISVSMPQGAQVEPRGHNIMAAAQATEDETRVVYKSGGEKIVLMAYDIHAVAGSAFRDNAVKFFRSSPESKNLVVGNEEKVASGLACVNVREQKTLHDEEANIVRMVLVRAAGGRVYLLELYANPQASVDWKNVSGLADRIFNTVAQGIAAEHDSNGGKCLLDEYIPLSINLSSNIAKSVQNGPDFRVIHLSKVHELGSPGTSLGIYIGHFPDFHPPVKAASVPGVVFGRKVKWYKSADNGVTTLETLTGVPKDNKTVLHIFASSPTDSGISEMKTTAETLTASR